MSANTDDSDDEDCVEVIPVIHQNVSDEVYDWSCHYYEEDEHGNHFEEMVCNCVKKKTEGNLKETDPFCSFESVAFVESEILVCAENVDADWKSSQDT